MKETAILTARGWSGAGPWFQTLAFKEPVIDGIVNVIQGASEKQKQAFSNGNIEVSTINGWLVTFKATTNKPIVNIPIEFNYTETGLETLNSVVIVGTKTSSTTFTGSATKEAFNKLKEGNVPLIVSILDSTSKATSMSIRLPSYTYDIGSNTISAMAPVIPTAGGSLSFWGVLIKGSNLTVSGFVSAGGGGGGDSVFWGAILGTLADQTDLATALDGKVVKMSGTSTNHRVYIHTKTGVEGSVLIAEQIDSDGLVTGNMVKNYVDTQDLLFILKTSIVNDLTTGGATNVASAETVKTLQTNKSKVVAKTSVTEGATEAKGFEVDGTTYNFPEGGATVTWGGITGNIVDQTDLIAKFNEKINTANIKTSWGATPGDGNVPSEKLTYDTLALKQAIATLETDVAAKGFTKNLGTITGITMNGASKGTSGVVDLGTVITDVSDKQDVANLVTSLSSASDNTHYPGAKAVYDFVVEMAADFKGSVATKADLATITGMNVNDWAIVLADESQSGKTTRYGYTGAAWNLQWAVNNTTFTTAQWDSINSGITATKVATYDGYAAQISEKADQAYVETELGLKVSTSNLDYECTALTFIKQADLQSGLATRQPLLTDAQMAAVNSGITATKVATYDGYATTKQNTITYGTADPSGGVDGDIYIKYTA